MDPARIKVRIFVVDGVFATVYDPITRFLLGPKIVYQVEGEPRADPFITSCVTDLQHSGATMIP